MDQAEASGKTVEDALNRALTKLGATRDEVEFVVLDEGRKGGLFGRGAQDAVVRVERLSTPGAPKPFDRSAVDTRIPRGPQRSGQGRGGPRPPRDADRPPREGGRGPQPAAGGDRAAPRGRFGGRGERAPRVGLEAATPKLTAEDFMRTPSYAEETGTPPPAAARGARPPREAQPRGERPPREPRAERPERPERGDRGERRRREEGPYVAPDINAEEVDFAAHIVDDLLRILDIGAELTIREPLTAGDGLGTALAVIDISGSDLGLLIGRRGDTLLSLQYIVNLIVNRRYPDRPGVTIDVEHYKHRREEQVVALATRMADRVRETGSPITLEPMSPAERRLVHILFADDPELVTNSIGEGDNRKVVISARQ